MIRKEDVEKILNNKGNVVGTDGDKIGGVGQFYLNDDTDQPGWLTVRTGLLGNTETFLPLEGARIDGNDVVTPYTKDQVTHAPQIDARSHLSPEDEDRLFAHYRSGQDSPRTYTERAELPKDRPAGEGSDAGGETRG